VARPMPEPAPVISATLPASRSLIGTPPGRPAAPTRHRLGTRNVRAMRVAS
jgi:hypothetical protein